MISKLWIFALILSFAFSCSSPGAQTAKYRDAVIRETVYCVETAIIQPNVERESAVAVVVKKAVKNNADKCDEAQKDRISMKANNKHSIPDTIDTKQYGTGTRGDMGRFVIPEKNFAVPIWDGLTEDVQWRCDQPDAAVIYTDGSTPVIGDHVNQGFDVIKTCKPGIKSYIESPYGEKIWYECMYVDPHGENNGQCCYTSDGEDIFELGKEYLACFTCNSCWTDITITVWVICDAP